MTDDTTSTTTVSDDQIGSWEDRPPVALSHPPLPFPITSITWQIFASRAEARPLLPDTRWAPSDGNSGILEHVKPSPIGPNKPLPCDTAGRPAKLDDAPEICR